MSKRQGFTLIELMVAMTLTMFVMLIITQAFTTTLDTFDGLKGLGDMEAHLRTVATSLRSDLAQNHFEGKRRMSEPDFWNTPLKQGFFHIRQRGGSQSEGPDSDSIASLASFTAGNTPSYHSLVFTNRLVSNQREKVYSAAGLPSGSPLLDPTKKTNYFGQPGDALYLEGTDRFNSQWATIAYFLVQTGSTAELDNPASTVGTPLHALYRAEYLLVPNTAEVNPPTNVTPVTAPIFAQHQNISMQDPGANAGNLVFNSPASVTIEANRDLDTSARNVPQRRGDSARIPPLGSTLLMTNVVSFNVRVQRYFESPYNALEGDFADLHNGLFDTSFQQTIPAASFTPAPASDVRYRIHALEITIRIWDLKTEQARQITVIQGL